MIDDDATGERVRQYVCGLEQTDRYIALLFYADRLSPIEIGMVLDLPTTTVATRLDAIREAISRVMARTPQPLRLARSAVG